MEKGNNSWLWYIRGVSAVTPILIAMTVFLQTMMYNEIKELRIGLDSIKNNLHHEVVMIRERISKLEERTRG